MIVIETAAVVWKIGEGGTGEYVGEMGAYQMEGFKLKKFGQESQRS